MAVTVMFHTDTTVLCLLFFRGLFCFVFLLIFCSLLALMTSYCIFWLNITSMFVILFLNFLPLIFYSTRHCIWVSPSKQRKIPPVFNPWSVFDTGRSWPDNQFKNTRQRGGPSFQMRMFFICFYTDNSFTHLILYCFIILIIN